MSTAFFNVVTKKFRITGVVYIIFLLDTINPYSQRISLETFTSWS